MGDYTIKGRSDTREVWDGAVLVGRIHRHQREVVEMKVHLVKSASLRKRVEVYWTATWPDGAPVRKFCKFRNRPVRMSRSTMKDWKSVETWRSAETQTLAEKEA
jgi:hypothetical protein